MDICAWSMCAHYFFLPPFLLLYMELSSLGLRRQMRVQGWDETTIFHHRQYKTRAWIDCFIQSLWLFFGLQRVVPHTHAVHDAVIGFKASILSVTLVTASSGLRILAVPGDPPLPMSSLLHLALWNVLAANQWWPASWLPSATAHLAVWNVLFHSVTWTIDFLKHLPETPK